MKVSVYITSELLTWLEDQVVSGRFASVSHGVRVAIQKLKENKKEASS